MEKKRISCYEEAVEYICGIPRFTSKNTMDDIRAFLRKLGNPGERMKVIHVAGTNGKGSVCAYLCGVLRSAGYTTCRFTSPHLTDIRERFVINDKIITKDDFLEAFLTVYENLSWEKLRGEGGYHPTFFEYLFFMAMLLFEKAQTDYCVLETGLGGRLDATNAVSRKDMAIITHLGMDHMEYLGNSPEKIAKEKAGIMQEGSPVVFWQTVEQVDKVLFEEAGKLSIPVFSVSKSDYTFLTFHNKSIDFSYQSLYYDSVRLCVHTMARYQMENAALALRALEVLFGDGRLTPKIMQKGLQDVFWAGRMEEVNPGVFVDGAHNEDGIRAFLETVAQDGCTSRRHLLFGVVQDKEYGHMMEEILSSRLFSDISLVQIKNGRALTADKLSEVFTQFTGKEAACYRSVREAVKAVLDAKKVDERVYIAGSLYLVGEIKELL